MAFALPLYIAKAAHDPYLRFPLPRRGARRLRHRTNPRHYPFRVQGMCCFTLTLPLPLYLYTNIRGVELAHQRV